MKVPKDGMGTVVGFAEGHISVKISVTINEKSKSIETFFKAAVLEVQKKDRSRDQTHRSWGVNIST